MKAIKSCIIIIALAIFLSNQALAQEKLYFLADTINVSKENRILKIGSSMSIEFSFIFYCKCVPPYEEYVEFNYFNNKKSRETTSTKPAVKYISWRQLQDLLAKQGTKFDRYNELYITEVLPGNKYRTNKVALKVKREVVN